MFESMLAMIQSMGQNVGWALLSLVPTFALVMVGMVIEKRCGDRKATFLSLFVLSAIVIVCLSAVSVKIYQLNLSACDKAYLNGYDKGQKDFLEGK